MMCFASFWPERLLSEKGLVSDNISMAVTPKL